jgi:NAD(P)-dependent dehydrogenase (short-subunit alcohol dehydrogenase family)
MDLTQQTALVTGGGSGIGLGIALALAREGCRVAIAGRSVDRLRAAAEQYGGEPGIEYRACDVARREEVTALVDWFEGQWGTPGILVNSAGINVARRTVADLDPADWDRMMAVNASGAFYSIQAVLPGMRRRRSGLIVNICSVSGKRALKLGGVGYCASKFAMSALGAGVNLEERENGIRVTTIYPGEVNTPILAQRPTPVPPERKAEMLQPDDFGAIVLTLARLPERVMVPELVITPRYQEWA